MLCFVKPNAEVLSKFNELVEYEDKVSDILGEPDSILISECDAAIPLSSYNSINRENPLDNCTDFSVDDMFKCYVRLGSKVGSGAPGRTVNVYTFLMDSRHMGKCIIIVAQLDIYARFEAIKGKVAVAGMHELLKRKEGVDYINNLDGAVISQKSEK